MKYFLLSLIFFIFGSIYATAQNPCDYFQFTSSIESDGTIGIYNTLIHKNDAYSQRILKYNNIFGYLQMKQSSSLDDTTNDINILNKKLCSAIENNEDYLKVFSTLINPQAPIKISKKELKSVITKFFYIDYDEENKNYTYWYCIGNNDNLKTPISYNTTLLESLGFGAFYWIVSHKKHCAVLDDYEKISNQILITPPETPEVLKALRKITYSTLMNSKKLDKGIDAYLRSIQNDFVISITN